MLPTDSHKHLQLHPPKWFPSSAASAWTPLARRATSRLRNQHQNPPNCVPTPSVFCNLIKNKINKNKIKDNEENENDEQDYDNVIF
mmetsp:Transcript_18960/g.19211  ORF Transcript_18960/g.19211 Transcript_18960/m.19211 type:complete len:86 (+) Transcript_18960:410-667(+)